MSVAQDDPRVYLAEERTFLAWIRTGLALMGVGFAVARFGLFLRELRAVETHAPVHATGLSMGSGVGLLAIGVAVNMFAVVRHARTVHAFREGSWEPGRVSIGAVVLSLMLAVVGLAMVIWLLYLG